MAVEIAGLPLNQWIGWLCIVSGAFFAITGALGVIRLPDMFSRMHAAGMIDSLGAGLILIGLVFQSDEWIVIAKLLLILGFIFFTSPTTTFALARAALSGGIVPGPKHKSPKNPVLKDKTRETSPSNT